MLKSSLRKMLKFDMFDIAKILHRFECQISFFGNNYLTNSNRLNENKI